MGSDQSKYAGSGETSAEVQEVRLDYYTLLNVDEEATDDEIKVGQRLSSTPSEYDTSWRAELEENTDSGTVLLSIESLPESSGKSGFLESRRTSGICTHLPTWLVTSAETPP
jgi:hypothetical protein